jgi:hypothetical protein
MSKPAFFWSKHESKDLINETNKFILTSGTGFLWHIVLNGKCTVFLKQNECK